MYSELQEEKAICEGLLAQREKELEDLREAEISRPKINGDLYEAQVTLGRALIRMGRPADAVKPLQKAAILAPNNPEPHFQLAIAYRRIGKTTEAAEETATVQRLNSNRREPEPGSPGPR